MSRHLARRLRSRDNEQGSTVRRMVKPGTVHTTEIADRAATAIKLWPGGPRVRPGDLTAETVQALDGRFTVGETVTLSGTSQDPDGALEWSVKLDGKVPAGFGGLTLTTTDIPTSVVGYYDLGGLVFELASATGAQVTVLAVDSSGGAREVGRYDGTSEGWARFDHNFHLGVLNGESIRVVVSEDVTGSFTGSLYLVEPVVATPALVLHGFDSPDTRPASITIAGNNQIEVGDLLVAFLSTAEPTLTEPAGWVTEASGSFGESGVNVPASAADEEQYRLYSRVAQAGDDEASWTWSATGGAGPELSLGVTVLIIKGASAVDGTPDFGRDQSTDTLPLSTTLAAAGTLLAFVLSNNGGAASAEGMAGLWSARDATNVDGARYTTVLAQEVGAGAHSKDVAAPFSSGVLAGFLVGVN